MDSVLHTAYNRSLAAQYCLRDVIKYNVNSQTHAQERTVPQYMHMFLKSKAHNANNNNKATENVMARLAKKYQAVGTIPTKDWRRWRSWKGETQVLGSGVYGTAVRGIYLPTKEEVVVKEYFTDPDATMMAKHEAFMLQSLEDTGITPKCYGVILENGKEAVVMEFLKDYKTLVDVLSSRKRLTQRQRLDIALKITEGLDRMHRKKIFHNDLKTDNIMVNMTKLKKPRVKIIDVGGASDHPLRLSINDPYPSGAYHIAPEMKRGQPSCAATEVFSLGQVLDELSGGPFITPGLHRLAVQCTQEDPRDRPLMGLLIHQLKNLTVEDTSMFDFVKSSFC